MQTHSVTLGLNIPNEGKVTNQMWSQFLETEIATRLDFATITDAIGIYKGEIESSKIVSVTIDERSTHSDSIVQNLKRVAAEFKTQFRQECTLYQIQEAREFSLV
jgi:hypothetical protein